MNPILYLSWQNNILPLRPPYESHPLPFLAKQRTATASSLCIPSTTFLGKTTYCHCVLPMNPIHYLCWQNNVLPLRPPYESHPLPLLAKQRTATASSLCIPSTTFVGKTTYCHCVLPMYPIHYLCWQNNVLPLRPPYESHPLPLLAKQRTATASSLCIPSTTFLGKTTYYHCVLPMNPIHYLCWQNNVLPLRPPYESHPLPLLAKQRTTTASSL